MSVRPHNFLDNNQETLIHPDVSVYVGLYWFCREASSSQLTNFGCGPSSGFRRPSLVALIDAHPGDASFQEQARGNHNIHALLAKSLPSAGAIAHSKQANFEGTRLGLVPKCGRVLSHETGSSTVSLRTSTTYPFPDGICGKCPLSSTVESACATALPISAAGPIRPPACFSGPSAQRGVAFPGWIFLWSIPTTAQSRAPTAHCRYRRGQKAIFELRPSPMSTLRSSIFAFSTARSGSISGGHLRVRLLCPPKGHW
jgi:hypothetical protein